MTIPSPCQPAWDAYLSHTSRFVAQYKPKTVLKTDADNEANDRPAIVPNIQTNHECHFTIIEYVQKVIDSALRKYPDLNIVQGDIRDLPFPDKAFDMIVDNSTIDHIPPKDLSKTLDEYSRILDDAGLMHIVIWCAIDPEDISQADEWNPTTQYFHWFDDLKKYFTSPNYKIIEEGHISLKHPCFSNAPWKKAKLMRILVKRMSN